MTSLFDMRPEVERRLSWRKKLARIAARHMPATWRFPLMGIPIGLCEVKKRFSQIENCLLIPNGVACYHGSHLDEKKRLALNATTDWDHAVAERFFLKHKMRPKIKDIPGKILSLATNGDINYYHWLIETLPRLKFVEKKLHCFDGIYVTTRHAFHREMWRHLNCSHLPIISSSEYPFLQAEQLIVPPYVGFNAEGWKLDWLRKQFQAVSTDSLLPRRIYISRRNASSRQIVNEEVMQSILKEFRFTTVTLEALPWDRQIAHFKQADIVIGPHGAGLTNLCFCQPGIQAIEILPKELTIPCYANIGQIAQLNYHQFYSQSMDSTQAAGSGMQVDLDAFRELLRQVAR